MSQDPLKERPEQDVELLAESQRLIKHCDISEAGYKAAIKWAENYVEMAKGDGSDKRVAQHLLFLSMLGQLEKLAKQGSNRATD